MLTFLYILLLIAPLNYCKAPANFEVRQKVAMLDTGLYKYQEDSPAACKDGHFSYSSDIYARHPHGPNIFGLIASNLDIKKYCIVSIKYYDAKNSENYVKALYQTLNIPGLVGLNLSLSSKGALSSEIFVLKKLVSQGVLIIAAAGNNGEIVDNQNCDYYPACIKKELPALVVVGSSTGVYGNRYTGFDMVYEDGTKKGLGSLTGTSQATAIHTGKRFSK